MGIDIGSALIVGKAYKDMESWIEAKAGELDIDPYKVVEQFFDYASPHYDSSIDVWIIGIEVGCYDSTPNQVILDMLSAAERFLFITGVEATVFQTPHVY